MSSSSIMFLIFNDIIL